MRDNFTCTYCETVFYLGIGLSIDHYIPRFKGGGNRTFNLITSCLNCNYKKGAKSSREWYAWLRKMRGMDTTNLKHKIYRQRRKNITTKHRKLGGRVHRLKKLLLCVQKRREE